MLRMMKTATAMTAITGAMFTGTLFTGTTMAQSVCNDRAKFVEQLSGGYAENTVAMGLVNNGSILEILTSNKGSWTILITKPDGISCVVAAGDAWEDVPKILLKGPSA